MLTIDVHEPIHIQIKLEKLGIPCKRKALNIGDYQFSDIIIERKTAKDFLSSVYSGRLFDQLYNLKQASPRPLLIIVGRLPVIKWRKVKNKRIAEKVTYEELARRKTTIRANLAICYLSYGIPFYWAENETDFIQFLMHLYFKANKKKTLKPVKKKSHSIREIKSDMISCIPSFSRKLANQIADKYSIKELSNLSKNELKGTIEGLGDKRIDRLIEVLQY